MRRQYLWSALLVLSVSCDDPPGLGEAGGGCRTGPDPCNGDMVCDQGECVDPEDALDPGLSADDFVITLEPERLYLAAGGEDTLKLSIRMLQRADGKPYAAPILVRTLPLDAATLEPSRLTLENGQGEVTVRSCKQGPRVPCVEKFRVAISADEAPSVVLAQTFPIQTTGLSTGGGDGGGDGAGGGAGGGEGGGGSGVIVAGWSAGGAAVTEDSCRSSRTPGAVFQAARLDGTDKHTLKFTEAQITAANQAVTAEPGVFRFSLDLSGAAGQNSFQTGLCGAASVGADGTVAVEGQTCGTVTPPVPSGFFGTVTASNLVQSNVTVREGATSAEDVSVRGFRLFANYEDASWRGSFCITWGR